LNGPKNEEIKRLGQTFDLETNQNLRQLLRRMNLDFENTYATNLFPFIKSGRLDTPISAADMTLCASRYAIPQIEIVAPKMVVCLGKKTFDAILRALRQPTIPWTDALQGHRTLLDDIEIYASPHTARWGIMNAGGMRRVHEIWERLAACLLRLGH
jgi:restriction system protein